ncbi:MAG TPA: DUF6174 domain-containing protein [Spirochaetota bacterium]|nr:DUF6174 domain-containing protein [Spirochaetota bacterium]HPN82736.1 DUF6174 domain-containing protein [Spirochaetota bacterium]
MNHPGPVWNRILSLLCLIILTSCSNGVKQEGDLLPKRDSADEIACDYRETLKKWQESAYRHYTMYFRYGAFSPVAGDWEIEIKDGRVVKRMQNGQPVPAERPTMTNMRMERLFELAAQATNTGHHGPMRIFARFSRRGWVAEVSREKNPDSDLPMPKDVTWFYRVTSVTIH